MKKRDFSQVILQIHEEKLLERLEQEMRMVHIRKGVRLVEIGEQPHVINILVTGILRGFIIDKSGRDITDCFAFSPGEIAMGCNTLGEASLVNIEALTDCTVYQISSTALNELLAEHPTLMNIYFGCLTKALKRHWTMKMILYRYTAMERYTWFLKNHPGLIGAVSNKHIASFLNMTPVTLSRLRRQLRGDTGPGEGDGPSH